MPAQTNNPNGSAQNRAVADLRDYFDVLIRRWRIVAAMPLLAMVAALLLSWFLPPTFEATAIVALAPSTLSVPANNQAPPYYLMVDSPRQLPTAFTPAFYVEFLKSAEVVKAVLPRAPVSISINSADKSLIEITARGGDPDVVSQTANTYAQIGSDFITKLLLPNGEQTATAQRKLDATDLALVKFSQDNGLGDYDLAKLRAGTSVPRDKRLELARLLRERDVAEAVFLDFAREQERAQILAITTFRPTPITKPAPPTPVSPKPIQNVLIAAGFGLLVGIVAAFAIESVSRKK